MTMDSLTCFDSRRSSLLRQQLDDEKGSSLNGLETVEVGDDFRTLRVYFFGKAPENLVPGNFLITGGKKIPELHVARLWYCSVENPRLDDCVDLELDQAGDLSTYLLQMVEIERGRPAVKPLKLLQGLDPRHATVAFSFSVVCANDIDCRPEASCQEEPWPEPDINYVAKDYASFRQLLLDRLALLVPDWKERHIPDLGLTLVELLAYVGDYLSYYQDAVATEAYLHTARQRISVRRHVRLIDYHMHEGCNARAFVHLEVTSSLEVDPATIYFITNLYPSGSQGEAILTHDTLQAHRGKEYEVFEPVKATPIRLAMGHNEIPFYTWGDRECVLGKGATKATLLDEWVAEDSTRQESGTPTEECESETHEKRKGPSTKISTTSAPVRKLRLEPGDFILFQEVKGPQTGKTKDADPSRRHVVRLTKVEPASDPIILVGSGEFSKMPTPVLNIEWSMEDALPFSLCVSTLGPPPACNFEDKVSVARGNLILVDHGKSLRGREDLGVAPLQKIHQECVCECESTEPMWESSKFRPHLSHGAVTYRSPLSDELTSVATWLQQDPRKAVPCLSICSIPPVVMGEGVSPLFTIQDLQDLEAGDPTSSFGQKLASARDFGDETLKVHLSSETVSLLNQADLPKLNGNLREALLNDLEKLLQIWEPQPDLLHSEAEDAHVVVEIDDHQQAHLRFGDGRMGRVPDPGAWFFASYRIGNGTPGNVGPETIGHAVVREGILSGALAKVWNPLPATGGRDPEPIADVKILAPAMIRHGQDRAVTTNDYARLAEQHTKVQKAAAHLRWIGYRQVVQVAIDPWGSTTADTQLLKEVANRLETVRRIGHEVEVVGAEYVPLDLQLIVSIKPDYIRAHVRKAILDQLSSGFGPDGQPGFFHPDRFSFGDSLFHSKLIAEVHGVIGVEAVEVTRFQRLFESSHGELEQGVLRMSASEVLQLANDPSFPERGKLDLILKGGK